MSDGALRDSADVSRVQGVDLAVPHELAHLLRVVEGEPGAFRIRLQ